MVIQDVKCPSCSAPLRIMEGSPYVTCDYCGVSSIIEYSGDSVVLKIAGELKNSIERTSQQTDDAIRATAQATKDEFEKLHLSNQLAYARTRLISLESEIRQIEREKKSRKAKQQLNGLKTQRKHTLTDINNIEIKLGNREIPVGNGNKKNSNRGCLWILIGIGLLVMCSMLSSILISPSDSSETAIPTQVETFPSIPAQLTPTTDQSRIISSPSATRTTQFTLDNLPTLESTNVPSSAKLLPRATVIRNANLRNGPGTSYEIIGIAPEGQIITIHGSTEDGWLKLNEEGTRWISTSLVNMETPVSVKITATP